MKLRTLRKRNKRVLKQSMKNKKGGKRTQKKRANNRKGYNRRRRTRRGGLGNVVKPSTYWYNPSTWGNVLATRSGILNKQLDVIEERINNIEKNINVEGNLDSLEFEIPKVNTDIANFKQQKIKEEKEKNVPYVEGSFTPGLMKSVTGNKSGIVDLEKRQQALLAKLEAIPNVDKERLSKLRDSFSLYTRSSTLSDSSRSSTLSDSSQAPASVTNYGPKLSEQERKNNKIVSDAILEMSRAINPSFNPYAREGSSIQDPQTFKIIYSALSAIRRTIKPYPAFIVSPEVMNKISNETIIKFIEDNKPAILRSTM